METPQNAAEMQQVVKTLNYQRDYDPFAKWALEQLSSLMVAQERQIEELKKEVQHLRLRNSQEYQERLRSSQQNVFNYRMDNKTQQLAYEFYELNKRVTAVEELAAQQSEAVNRHEYRLYKGYY